MPLLGKLVDVETDSQATHIWENFEIVYWLRKNIHGPKILSHFDNVQLKTYSGVFDGQS